MSAQDSFLSAYGIDMVVATTEKAINATIKQYIHEFGRGASPTFKAYYMMNGDADTQILNSSDVASLISNNLSNTDPLTVSAWNGTGARPAAIANIQPVVNGNFKGYIEDMVFRYAISFELGFPGGTIPSKDIVQLSDDGQYATYTLCFQNLTLTVANYNNDIYNGITSYEVYTQTASRIYEFIVRVPLNAINDSSNAPDTVAQQAATLGNAFTMQQLVLDLDNASWYSQPAITDAPANSEVYKMLDTVFLPLYAQLMAANGRAALGFNFIPTVPASQDFAVSNVQLQIDDVQNGEGTPSPAIATLDYLCAINGRAPQAPADFSDPDNYYLDGLPYWSWFDSVPTVHGVISISPQALGDYFSKALLDYVKTNCYYPTTSFYYNEDKEMWMCNTPSVQAGQIPTVTITPDGTGPFVTLSYTPTPANPMPGYSYQRVEDAHQQLTPTFTLTVSRGDNNTLVVKQELVFYYEIEYSGSTAKGNIVDTIITDTYTLATNSTGKYDPVVTTATQDKSQSISVGWLANLFDGDLNSVLSQIKSWAQTLSSKTLTDIPISVMQGLVFPGGNAFSMNDLSYSDGGDLIANITYATPSYINN